MKRKDKYLLGFIGGLNVVYGSRHEDNCDFWEQPVTLSRAKKIKQKVDKSTPSGFKIRIFKLVELKS